MNLELLAVVKCEFYCFLPVPEYQPVNLGASLGKVAAGSHTTAGFKEDKRNKATPGKKSFPIEFRKTVT